MRWVTFVTQMLLLLHYANADVYDTLEAMQSYADLALQYMRDDGGPQSLSVPTPEAYTTPATRNSTAKPPYRPRGHVSGDFTSFATAQDQFALMAYPPTQGALSVRPQSPRYIVIRRSRDASNFQHVVRAL